MFHGEQQDAKSEIRLAVYKQSRRVQASQRCATAGAENEHGRGGEHQMGKSDKVRGSTIQGAAEFLFL
jgi:hypothetical protein